MIYNFVSHVNKIFWICIHTESQDYMSEETTQLFAMFVWKVTAFSNQSAFL